MSSNQTSVDKQLEQYLNDNFSSEDQFLFDLRNRANEEGIPSIHIAPSQGKIIQMLLKSINAKNVLEIGTLAGYSSITMARALPDDGNLITIESEFKHAVFAQKMVNEAGLSHIIQVQNSDAKEFLKTYQPEFEFDFVFVDADKPSYRYYLDVTTKMLRIGGIFAADNAFAFGFLTSSKPERNPEDVKSIQGFNNYFKNHTQYFTSIIPTGDGMILGIKTS